MRNIQQKRVHQNNYSPDVTGYPYPSLSDSADLIQGLNVAESTQAGIQNTVCQQTYFGRSWDQHFGKQEI